MGKIDLNKTENLLKLKEEISNVIEKRINESKRNELIDSIDNLSFGTLKSLFECMTDKLYSSSNGKKLIGRYLKNITENKDLSKLYMVYDYIQHPNYVSNSSMFLNENISLARDLNKKKINEGIKKSSEIIKNCINECKISNDELNEVIKNNSNINESIDYLIHNPKTVNNLNTYVDKLSEVSNFMNGNMPQNNLDESVKNTKELIDELNDLYSNDLSLWENKVIKDISLLQISNGNKEDLFNQYKNDCLNEMVNYLNNEKNIEEKSQISLMKEQLENKQYNEDNFYNDLLKLSELKNTLNK